MGGAARSCVTASGRNTHSISVPKKMLYAVDCSAEYVFVSRRWSRLYTLISRADRNM